MKEKVKVPVVIDLKKYDFDALREKFAEMKIREVMQEYVMILNELSFLEEHIDEPVFSAYAEPLLEAELFLSGYLARMVCDANGFAV